MSEDWSDIDPLVLDGHNIQAVQAIREQFGYMHLHTAIDLLQTRFEHLRRSRPDDSAVS